MSKRKWIVSGCGVLILLLVGFVVLGAPAAIALRLAGFRSEGRTEAFLEEQAVEQPPTLQWSTEAQQATEALAPTPTPGTDPSAVEEVVPVESIAPATQVQIGPLDQVVIDIWFLSQPTAFSAEEIYVQRLERGLVEGDRVAYYIEYDQAGLNAYLNRWFSEYVTQNDRVRNASIDLLPGGAMVYADVNLEIGWQRVGAAFMLDSSGQQLSLVGVDIDGRFYSTPPAGSVAELARQLERESNRALRELAFIDPAGRLTVREISLSPEQAQILAY
jgi:hypothetical protein